MKVAREGVFPPLSSQAVLEGGSAFATARQGSAATRPQNGAGTSCDMKSLCVLGLLSLATLLGSYDRYLVAILIEHIKHDLGASDAQVGLLTGLGFAAVYSVMALPIGRLSDRGHRMPVLTLSLLLWCVMTALCGLAPGFWLLLLARLGVALGEAGGIPTIQALVVEYFPGRWRTTALSVTVVMAGVGFTAANTVGGWIADQWGWRMAFAAGAAPGPLLAYLLWSTVREPARATSVGSVPPASVSLPHAVAILLKVRSFRFLCCGYAVATIAAYASIAWIPAYLMRRYDLSAGQVGAGYGLAAGCSLILALLGGGILADTLARRDQRWPLWLISLLFCAGSPLTITFLFANNLGAAIALAVPMTISTMAGAGVAYSLALELSGPRLRATGSALFLLCTNLIGMGLGPSLAGFASDLLAPELGGASLQYTLAIFSIAYLAGGILIAAGSRTVRRDIASAHSRGLKLHG